jgi:hypothetical protein
MIMAAPAAQILKVDSMAISISQGEKPGVGAPFHHEGVTLHGDKLRWR